MFVFSSNGTLFQPAGLSFPAWPRYNTRTGTGGDADRNGEGHPGYGCYGLNVGIGNIDDDADLEIIVTYDNHAIQAFKLDGVAIDASPWFTNRASAYLGKRLTWGQFIRWADPQVEENHYHLHTGAWPNPAGQEWLQWTASPPNVVDLDGDGQQRGRRHPQRRDEHPLRDPGLRVHGARRARTATAAARAMRLAGWETLPRGGAPISRRRVVPARTGVPAPVTVNIQGDSRPEIVVSLNDGFMYAFSAGGSETLALQLHPRQGGHVRLGSHRRRPQPGRLAGDHLHHLRGAR